YMRFILRDLSPFYYSLPCCLSLVFSFPDSAPTEIYTLSLHDALPIYSSVSRAFVPPSAGSFPRATPPGSAPSSPAGIPGGVARGDRKSTRLNSSHVKISYAVFCLKKKNKD